MGRKVILAPANQAVDHPHAIALFDQQIDHVTADEPRPAGHDGNRPSRHAAPIARIVRTL